MSSSQTRGAVAAPLPVESANDIIKASERHLRALALGMAGGDDVLADELTQAGRIGLWIAIRKFDPTIGVPLPRFAARYVRGQMLNVLREKRRFRHRYVLFSELDGVDAGGDQDDALEPVERAIEASIYRDQFTCTIDATAVHDSDLAQEVALFVEGLPVRLRLVIQKVIWDEMPQAAAAADLGVSRMAVTKYMKRIRAQGRQALVTVTKATRVA